MTIHLFQVWPLLLCSCPETSIHFCPPERWRLSFVKGWPLRLLTLGSVLLSAFTTAMWDPAMEEEGKRGSLSWLHPDVSMGA